MKYFLLILFSILLILPLGARSVSALTWYPGEGLKQGDYYRYSDCFTDWNNCTPIELDFWVQNQTSDGNWNLQVLIIDGSNIQRGNMVIGTVTPDPLSFSPNIADYANVYKNTIAWLDAFATQLDPKDFSYPAWGRTGSVGGQSVGPENQEQVVVPAGTYNAWVVGWHKGVDNKLWVVPTMPFPVKALVFTDVTSGSPPPQFNISLLETGNSQTLPTFFNKVSSTSGSSATCPTNDTSAVSNSQTLDSGNMVIQYRYSPAVPHQGCPVHWSIYFGKTFDTSQDYSQVQYDFYTVDDQGKQIDSVAQELGKTSLFAPVGTDFRDIVINQPPPATHYILNVAGTGPEGTAPDPSLSGFIKIDVQTAPSLGGAPSSTTVPIVIPTWIKNNAGWWATGQIGDSDFIKGIQYMINQGIMKIGQTQHSNSASSQQIPVWIKNNAGWWATGQIGDSDFVKGIQYLVQQGIIQVS